MDGEKENLRDHSVHQAFGSLANEIRAVAVRARALTQKPVVLLVLASAAEPFFSFFVFFGGRFAKKLSVSCCWSSE